MLGLRCCTCALSSCGKQGLLCGSGFACCRARALECQLSSWGVCTELSCGMWDLPGSGIEPVSPALAGGFLITRPPGKTFSLSSFLLSCPNSYQPEKITSAGSKTQMSGLWNVYDTNRNSDTRYWSSSVDLHTCQPITWGEEINVVKLGLHIATGLAVKDPALFQVSASGLWAGFVFLGPFPH